MNLWSCRFRYLLAIVYSISSFSGPLALADIYKGDDITRTIMSETERHFPAVQVLRDSGVLLSNSMVLTASHVIKNRSNYIYHGSTFFNGPDNSRYYFKLESVVEEDTKLDYAIIKISWKDGVIPPQLQVVSRIIYPGEINYNQIYPMSISVLGAPWDRIPNPIKSIGNKFIILSSNKVDPDMLIFNAGAIDGNSGSPLFTKNNVLLGIVIGGPHQLGEEGYKNNDPNDIKLWNHAIPIESIYKKSKTLQGLWPH